MALENLTDAERRLVRAAAAGEIWRPDKENRIDAAVLRCLALREVAPGEPAPWPVHAKGIRANGANVTGVLDLQSTRVDIPLWLFDCAFDEPLVLRDAELRVLGLRGARLRGMDGHRMQVAGALLLSQSETRPFACSGRIDLSGAMIAGELSLLGAEIGGDGPVALDANGARVGASLFLRQLTAHGLVDLTRITIAGNLHAQGAMLDHPGTDKVVLIARGARIGGDVFCRQGLSARGALDFTRAEIQGSLLCDGARMETPGGTALSINQARIGAALQLSQSTAEDRRHACLKGHLDLRGAAVNEFRDDGTMWPDARTGHLKIDGFVYQRFGGRSTITDARRRIRWLKRQRPRDLGNEFKAQPWEQLKTTLRSMGHGNDARRVAIAKARALHGSGTLTWPQWLWSWFSGLAVGYGYEPMRAVWLSALVWLIGAMVFSSAARIGIMAPAEATVLTSPAYIAERRVPPDYPEFNPWRYSFDVFIPFDDLFQQRYWLPSREVSARPQGATLPTDSVARGWATASATLDATLTRDGVAAWHWLQIVLGWVLTSLAIAGFSGLLRPSDH